MRCHCGLGAFALTRMRLPERIRLGAFQVVWWGETFYLRRHGTGPAGCARAKAAGCASWRAGRASRLRKLAAAAAFHAGGGINAGGVARGPLV